MENRRTLTFAGRYHHYIYFVIFHNHLLSTSFCGYIGLRALILFFCLQQIISGFFFVQSFNFLNDIFELSVWVQADVCVCVCVRAWQGFLVSVSECFSLRQQLLLHWGISHRFFFFFLNILVELSIDLWLQCFTWNEFSQ